MGPIKVKETGTSRLRAGKTYGTSSSAPPTTSKKWPCGGCMKTVEKRQLSMLWWRMWPMVPCRLCWVQWSAVQESTFYGRLSILRGNVTLACQLFPVMLLGHGIFMEPWHRRYLIYGWQHNRMVKWQLQVLQFTPVGFDLRLIIFKLYNTTLSTQIWGT